ncbi:hypothetical protein D3C87_125000 [compost metagenome]
MSETKGITELLELIAGLELVAVSAKEILKDGKIGVEDMAVLVKLAAQVDVIVKAIEGVKEIPAEAKDIDMAEAVAIVQRLYAAVAKVQAS